MVSVTEVGSDIKRINVEIPGKPVTFSLLLIRDEQPTLIETSYRRVFDEVIEALATVIDPSTLRHVVIPHFESDECGGLDRLLEAAPHAAPVCSPIGTHTSIPDFSIREPLPVDEGTMLDLGQHKLRFLVTPYVHAWDSLLAYDEVSGTLFSSDLFLQPGTGPPLTDCDISEEMVSSTRSLGLFASQAHLVAALDKIETLRPLTPACHHGTVKAGQIPAYLRAFRENPVTGLPPAGPNSLVHSRATEDRVVGPADLSDRPPPLLAPALWEGLIKGLAQRRCGACLGGFVDRAQPRWRGWSRPGMRRQCCAPGPFGCGAGGVVPGLVEVVRQTRSVGWVSVMPAASRDGVFPPHVRSAPGQQWSPIDQLVLCRQPRSAARGE